MTMPDKEAVNGVEERWSAGFVFETILTRDTWMHRIDTAEATGRPPALPADHDGSWWATWLRSGPRGTVRPTPSASPGRPAAHGRPGPGTRNWRWTPSCSTGLCLGELPVLG